MVLCNIIHPDIEYGGTISKDDYARLKAKKNKTKKTTNLIAYSKFKIRVCVFFYQNLL
jgi:hypothetical protein